MSQLHLSDEILMAFADGELDGLVATAVAQAMAEDPNVAKRIIGFQQSRRLTHSAFSSALTHEVPPELHAAVMAQIQLYEGGSHHASETDRQETRSQQRRGRGYSPLWMALAAAIATLGIAIGYFAGRQSDTAAGGLFAKLGDPLVRQQLSRVASGQEVELPIGHLRVISTYRAADGSLCREFKLQAAEEATSAVACRTNGWTVTFAIANASGGGGYTPSGGGDPMAAYLQEIGAGEPLVEEAETKALVESAH